MEFFCNPEMKKSLPIKPTPTTPVNTIQEDTHTKLLTRVRSGQIVVLPTQCVVAYHDVATDRAIATRRRDWGCDGGCQGGGHEDCGKEAGEVHGRFGGRYVSGLVVVVEGGRRGRTRELLGRSKTGLLLWRYVFELRE
jgi:hypothetical protein